MSLKEDLRTLEEGLSERLLARGFDASLFERLANDRTSSGNRVTGNVTPPLPEDLAALPATGTPAHRELAEIGEPFFRAGAVAFVVMAGGMATRMGGVVKGLVEVAHGRSFLDLRLAENRAFARRFGREMPLWLMTSAATDAPLRRALTTAGAPRHVATFEQGLGLRINEKDGRLFRDAGGTPSTCATGHGDLVDALRRSGLLAQFVQSGGRWVVIANVDNLGATPDPAIVGALARSGKKVLVEVCKKEPGDKGGIPVRVDGVPQILEEFRLPEGFDPSRVDVFNTNTFVVDAKALLEAEIEWTWFKVQKKVDGQAVLQFERLIQEIVAVLPALFLTVPRDGDAARFLPVKDDDELKKRRGSIEELANRRGWVERA